MWLVQDPLIHSITGGERVWTQAGREEDRGGRGMQPGSVSETRWGAAGTRWLIRTLKLCGHQEGQGISCWGPQALPIGWLKPFHSQAVFYTHFIPTAYSRPARLVSSYTGPW